MGPVSGVSPDQVLTDERLDDLERFRDVDFKSWREDVDRRFAEAFPGGDHVGHCRYHRLMIEHTEEVRRLRQAILEKTISGLIWAGIVIGGAAVWFYLKAQIKGG